MLREGLEHLSQVLHLVVVDVDFWDGWENMGKPGNAWEHIFRYQWKILETTHFLSSDIP